MPTHISMVSPITGNAAKYSCYCEDISLFVEAYTMKDSVVPCIKIINKTGKEIFITG